MKKLTGMWISAFALGLAALTGCAHESANAKVDREARQETSVKSSADLRNEEDQLIQNQPGLTADQRAQLRALKAEVLGKLDANHQQSLQLRSLMVKDLVKSDYDPKEVDALKQKLRDNANQRLSVTFDAVDKAKKILGKNTNSGAIMDNMMWERHE